MAVRPEDFNRKKQPKEIRDYCDLMRNRINEILTDMLQHNEPITSEKILSYLRQGGYKSETVEDVFNAYLQAQRPRIGHNLTYNAYHKYEAAAGLFYDSLGKDKEFSTITNADIVSFLDGLPQQKIHCSVMGAEALQAAVADWARKRGVDLAALGIEVQIQDEDEGRIVCKCFGLTEPYIRRKIKELNLRTVEELTGALKAGGACGSCRYAPGGLQDILDEVWGKASPSKTPEPAKPVVQLTSLNGTAGPAKPTVPAEELSPYQRAKKIESIIEETIRPILRSDGGDIEIVDIKGDLVLVSLQGACDGCASATQTIQLLVEDRLRTEVSDKNRVVQV